MPEPSIYYQPELTLPDLLYRASKAHPDLFIGYFDKNGELTKQTYIDLISLAERYAAGLHNLGLKKGDKIIIATRSNQETIALLWGSFFLRAVPTILQPPMTFSGYNPAVVKLMNVYEQLERPFIFMSPELREHGDFPEGKIKHAEELDCEGEYPKPLLKLEDLAFIQFSSGSTGDPKGIMLTHANLMANMDSIRVGLDAHFPDNIGNWMPLFHDMGLIGYHITPIYCLLNQFHIEAVDFIMKPSLWLDLMGRYQIAISGGTNFGLALVLRYLKRNKPLAEWNFSAMKALLNGAEPISNSIMQEFTNSLIPYGFRPEAMMPVYGLAEATLAVSFTPLMKPSVIGAFDARLLDRERIAREVDPADPLARLLSGVGVALNDVEIRILDEKGRPVPEGISGHLQVKGPSITMGYYNKPDSTTAAFQGEWFRTGDIGFFSGGHLFISGRQKDIIFKNGRNYFANDLEAMACNIKGISHGKICFGAHTSRETGHDNVIAFLAGVPDTQAEDMFLRLRALLRSNLGITVDELVLIKSNEMPKTSSGKLQRFKLMQRYVSGDFADRIFSRKGEGIS